MLYNPVRIGDSNLATNSVKYLDSSIAFTSTYLYTISCTQKSYICNPKNAKTTSPETIIFLDAHEAFAAPLYLA